MKTVTENITDAAIKRLFLAPEVTEVRDPRHPLRLRINKARTKASWFVVQYRGGKAIWRKVGNWPGIGAKLMIETLPRLLAGMEADPEKPVTAKHEISTVAELCLWYTDRMKRDRSITKGRKAGVKSAIKHRIIPLIGDMPVSDLTPASIDERFLMPLQGEYALSTVNFSWLLLKRMSKVAAALNLIESNPIASARFVDHIQAKIKPKAAKLKPSQAREVYRWIMATDHNGYMLAMLMLLHGTRIGETRCARWEHFDLQDGYWTIPAENTKTGQEHRLPLTELAKQHLVMFGYGEKRTGFLFPAANRRNPVSATVANDWIQTVSHRRWTSHDLRKMARSCWMDLGIDYMVCEFLLNHALNKLDKTYIHTHADVQMRAALNRYHEYLKS